MFFPAFHQLLSGAFVPATGAILIPVINCTEVVPGFAMNVAMGIQLDKAGGPALGSTIFTTDFIAPFNCAANDPQNTTTTGPLTLTPLAQSHNEDNALAQSVLGRPDGCTDYEELGSNALLGGLRDPFNPYDFFDVNGDKKVNLLGDITQVQLAFGQGPNEGGPGPNYSPAKDRGAQLGPNPWNREGPNGKINLLNDNLVVILQFGHDCTSAP